MRLAVAAFLLIGGSAQAQAPEPADFRGEPYRAPVPATLAGARVVSPSEAVALHQRGVAFIDVLPRQNRPENLPEATIWRMPPHLTIPGALWLHDTGYQRISSDEAARLADGLSRASHGDKAAPLVIFCKTDCWMSWNAAKRAVALGYSAVIWFPEGVEGWQAQGGKLTTPAE